MNKIEFAENKPNESPMKKIYFKNYLAWKMSRETTNYKYENYRACKTDSQKKQKYRVYILQHWIKRKRIPVLHVNEVQEEMDR